MTADSLSTFFFWCSVVNGAVLVFFTVMVLFAKNLIYRMHTMWFSISREHFELAMYCFLGLFKIMFLVFNLVPYIALKLMA